jgi:hypothetical protein
MDATPGVRFSEISMLGNCVALTSLHVRWSRHFYMVRFVVLLALLITLLTLDWKLLPGIEVQSSTYAILVRPHITAWCFRTASRALRAFVFTLARLCLSDTCNEILAFLQFLTLPCYPILCVLHHHPLASWQITPLFFFPAVELSCPVSLGLRASSSGKPVFSFSSIPRVSRRNKRKDKLGLKIVARTLREHTQVSQSQSRTSAPSPSILCHLVAT